MEAFLSGGIVDWLANLIDRVVQERQPVPAPQPIDALSEEICRLEQALGEMCARRPTSFVHAPVSLEPITEQQKIMDLAG